MRNKNNDECGAKISRSHFSTSQLFKHLKSCHRAQYNEVRKLRSKDNQLPANQKLEAVFIVLLIFDLIVIVKELFLLLSKSRLLELIGFHLMPLMSF